MDMRQNGGAVYGVVTESVTTIYECADREKESKGQQVSAIADEGLHGMLFCVTGQEKCGFLPVRTFYGYSGYVEAGTFRLLTEAEAKAWETGADAAGGSGARPGCPAALQPGDSEPSAGRPPYLAVVSGFCVDVVSVPRVQGIRLISLFRGSLVQVLAWDSEEPGWAKVRLADGRTGYLRNQYLMGKQFSQAGLWTMSLPQKKIVDEDGFRKAVTDTARAYLGVQYRWGGRSSAGIDCSGLTSSSYMLNGILTYRDAKIVEGYPVHAIDPEQKKPGDLLYFPGHIAMYLGEGYYIHSTGKVGSGGVVYNSFNQDNAFYRQDLVESLYAVGSIF